MQLNPSTLRLLALSASLALGTTSIARGDDSPPDQARPLPAQADADLDVADARTNQARTTADAARIRLSELSSRRDADQSQAKEIRQRMLDGGSGLRELQSAAQAANARLDARHQEIAAEGARYAPLKDAFEQAKLDAIREFNESPEYRGAVDAVNSAGATLHAAQVESLRQLSMTDAYRQAFDAMQSADAGLRAARRQFAPDSLELASAVKLTSDAHARFDALRDNRLAADPNLQIAHTTLTEAKTALDDLRRRFTEQLPQNSKVMAAERPLSLEQTQYDQMVAAVTAAEQQLAGAQAALRRQSDGLAADRAALDELTAEISKCEAELPGAQADADQANAELESAAAYANAARQARDAVYAVAPPVTQPPVTQPPAVVYQTFPYAYYPPAVVYVQPGGVYVGSPYYRNAFVQPRVYTYGPGAGYVYVSRASGGHHGGHR